MLRIKMGEALLQIFSKLLPLLTHDGAGGDDLRKESVAH